MFGQDDPYVLSVGRRSPFFIPPAAGNCATFVADAVCPIVAHQISSPTAADLSLYSFGRVDIGFDAEGDTAIFLWGFSLDGAAYAVLATPLHVGLEKARSFPNLVTTNLHQDEGRMIALVSQDEAGIIQLIRPLLLPRPILDAYAPLLNSQLAARPGRNLRKSYETDQARYYQRCPDLSLALSTASIKVRAA